MVHKHPTPTEHFFPMRPLLPVILHFVTEKHGLNLVTTTLGIELKRVVVYIHSLCLFLDDN
jgi:hypothetical protein